LVPSPALSIGYSGIQGARTNQVRCASPAASHVASNVFPHARVNSPPLHLRPKIRQPLRRRRPHGPLLLLPPRRRSSRWSEHSLDRARGFGPGSKTEAAGGIAGGLRSGFQMRLSSKRQQQKPAFTPDLFQGLSHPRKTEAAGGNAGCRRPQKVEVTPQGGLIASVAFQGYRPLI
jgi:hypothetical protein